MVLELVIEKMRPAGRAVARHVASRFEIAEYGEPRLQAVDRGVLVVDVIAGRNEVPADRDGLFLEVHDGVSGGVPRTRMEHPRDAVSEVERQSAVLEVERRKTRLRVGEELRETRNPAPRPDERGMFRGHRLLAGAVRDDRRSAAPEPGGSERVVRVMVGEDDESDRQRGDRGERALDQAGVRRRDQRIHEKHGLPTDDRRAVGAVARLDPLSTERPHEDVLAKRRLRKSRLHAHVNRPAAA